MKPVTFGITSALLIIMALLAGCTMLQNMTQPLHAPVAVENEDAMVRAYRLAHATVDEANAALTVLNRTIGNNAASGVWTKAHAQHYLDQSKEKGKDLDKAREALKLGNIASAQTQAEAVKKLVIALQKEVARRAQ